MITELDGSSGSLAAMGRETGAAPGGEDEDRVGCVCVRTCVYVCVEDRKHLKLLKCQREETHRKKLTIYCTLGQGKKR